MISHYCYLKHKHRFYLLTFMYGRTSRDFCCSGVFFDIFSYTFCSFFFFPSSGEWKVFSGNELGALLGWWIFTCWKNHNRDTCAVKDVYMLSSTVSSKILRAIALKEGFHFEVSFSVLFRVLNFLTYTVSYYCKTLLLFFMPFLNLTAVGNADRFQVDGQPCKTAHGPGKSCSFCI